MAGFAWRVEAFEIRGRVVRPLHPEGISSPSIVTPLEVRETGVTVLLDTAREGQAVPCAEYARTEKACRSPASVVAP